MRVTNVVFSKLCPVSKGVCAEASIVLDDEVCIHKVKVIQGDKGLFIAFPTMGKVETSSECKRFFDVAHPTTNKLRIEIQDELLSRYQSELNKGKKSTSV